ncbi:MAG: putative hemolysin [Planctomycetota bacterium]
MSAILVLLVGPANAMPNPSAVYCYEQGYEYEVRTEPDGDQIGVCVFPDDSECRAWQFYCNCEPDGVGCWSGDFDCHWPCEELPCREAGKHVLVSECCEGLTAIPPTYVYDANCDYTGMTGWTSICSDCGNGTCESWESTCNCPSDCDCLDVDYDGVNDCADNCPLVGNHRQDDSDDDGIGNFCDSDCPYLDGANPVNTLDLSIFAFDWQQSGPELQGDINGDHVVNVRDLAILAVYWLSDCT